MIVLEPNIQSDHVHLVVEIPPKYSISELMGYLKGKLPIRTIRKSRAAILGTSPVGARILCQHSRIG